jgi:phosphate transport system permease protein
MTDIAAPAVAGKNRSDARAALLAKRYRAERRFRAYGVGAIIITAIFLLLVMVDILWKGIPAFTEHRLGLQITADQAALDPDKTGDPRVLLAGDYNGLIRDALRAQFPAVESRADRRQLNALLSSGAADDFRRMIANDPSLVGQTIDVPLLLSDDADQYLKGYQTATSSEPGKGDLTLTADGATYRASSSSDDFAQAFADVREFLGKRLDALDAEVKRLQSAMDGLSPDVAATLQGQIDGLKVTANTLRDKLSDATASIELDPNLPSILVAVNGGTIKAARLDGASIEGEALIAPSTTGTGAPGSWSLVTLTTPEADRRVGDKEIIWLEQLRAKGEIEQAFATRFFTSGDSREPELAGLRGALFGSLLTLAVTLVLCLPIGVAAAIYLEEFAPKNRVTELIEININNLAAVPSIVFGLLGLAMFLNFFGLPRSAPLVGGLVLALLVLPTIIIASRAALRAVPPSIKEAALGVGASQQQAIFHHVLPLAMPGIMTGTIIGMAHALGETAPLLMIGMVAFIVDIPGGITDAATVLPVQIYLWSDLPEVAFQAKTAATIIVLLLFLFVMNSIAILVRRRFERRW